MQTNVSNGLLQYPTNAPPTPVVIQSGLQFGLDEQICTLQPFPDGIWDEAEQSCCITRDPPLETLLWDSNEYDLDQFTPPFSIEVEASE
jgi:hypothetical protein